MKNKIGSYLNLKKISEYGKYFINFMFNDNNNKQILDPLTTIIKIALLNFYDIGTKIGIINNSIEIQETSFFQGTYRWGTGDSRTKLYNLKEPIQNCLLWFPYLKYKELKVIYEYSIKGLEKLKTCYCNLEGDGNNTIHLIEYYISIIKNNLNEEKNIEKSIILNKKIQIDIKKIWDKEDIKLINIYFQILIKKDCENKDNIINSINQFLKDKDLKTQSFLKKYTTEL